MGEVMARKGPRTNKSNGANLGFEATLWKATDKLRNNMDAAEYKHVVLDLGKMNFTVLVPKRAFSTPTRKGVT